MGIFTFKLKDLSKLTRIINYDGWLTCNSSIHYHTIGFVHISVVVTKLAETIGHHGWHSSKHWPFWARKFRERQHLGAIKTSTEGKGGTCSPCGHCLHWVATRNYSTCRKNPTDLSQNEVKVTLKPWTLFGKSVISTMFSSPAVCWTGIVATKLFSGFVCHEYDKSCGNMLLLFASQTSQTCF